MMKNKGNNETYKDERISLQRLKIVNQAYLIIMVILMISILLQQFAFNAPFKSYLTEFIAFFSASIYILVRSIFAGHQLYGGRKKLSIILVPIITALVITLVSYFGNKSNAVEDGQTMPLAVMTLTFFSALIASYTVIFVVQKLGDKRKNKLEQKFDD